AGKELDVDQADVLKSLGIGQGVADDPDSVRAQVLDDDDVGPPVAGDGQDAVGVAGATAGAVAILQGFESGHEVPAPQLVEEHQHGLSLSFAYLVCDRMNKPSLPARKPSAGARPGR